MGDPMDMTQEAEAMKELENEAVEQFERELLAGSTDVERVVVGDEVKLARFRAVVGILDSDHYDYSDTEVVVDNPVPILSDDSGERIGYAALSLEPRPAVSVIDDLLYVAPSQLVAEAAIDYATPERLDVETGARRLWLVPCGEMDVVEGAGLGEGVRLAFQGARAPVEAIRLYYLVLTPEEPDDPRLQPLEALQ